MILVDTSVWIDHLHVREPALVTALEVDQVGQHPLVVQELAMGRLAHRDDTVQALRRLSAFPQLRHEEVLGFVDAHSLWGRGLSAVDAHLLGSVRLVPGAQLWTRERRMRAAAGDLGLVLFGG